MPRFVQRMPALPDVYAEDPILRSWQRRLLGDEGFAEAEGLFKALATDVMGPLRAAHADAEAHPPVLHRYDGWGARIDRIESSAGWERLRVAAAEHAIVALPYLASARQRWGAGARVVQHALLHLYGPESATFTCPIAMADGAAALLSLSEVDSSIRDAWLPRLISTDPAVAITSGQWMTESQGGSDVGRSTTMGMPAADGSWRLTGEKWFCSAIDSAMAVALVNPGASKDSKSLVPFLVPRYAADVPLVHGTPAPTAPAPGLTVHRLKDKLGTRAVPTGEVGLRDAYALPLGNPDGGGLARMMSLVAVTRVHNAAAAAAGMRRGLAYARAYADARTVAGGRLVHSPLHRSTLATLAVDAQAAFALAAHAFALLGRVETDPADHAAGQELRLVASLAKLTTGKLAVASASEYLECFGGAGFVEDTGLPRLLRDAQVLPIWEGTTNVLATDVVRTLGRDPGAGSAFMARLDAATEQASAMLIGGAVDGLRAARFFLMDALPAVAADRHAPAVVAGARHLALTMGYGLALALLVEHAAGTDDEATKVAAELWGRTRLTADETAADAHSMFEVLCP